MRIAILSDTHDNTAAVSWVIDYLNSESIEITLHAGDIVYPGILRRFRDNYHGALHFVFGNNDGELSAMTKMADETKNLICHSRDMELEIEEKKIFMNHYTSVAEAEAQTGNFDICIGGHSHHHTVETFGETLFINPGHLVLQDNYHGDRGQDDERGFVILDLANSAVERVLLPLNYLELH